MKIEKVEKLVAKIKEKKECYPHKNFKASIKIWISSKKKCIDSLIKKLG